MVGLAGLVVGSMLVGERAGGSIGAARGGEALVWG